MTKATQTSRTVAGMVTRFHFFHHLAGMMSMELPTPSEQFTPTDLAEFRVAIFVQKCKKSLYIL